MNATLNAERPVTKASLRAPRFGANNIRVDREVNMKATLKAMRYALSALSAVGFATGNN